jgi:polyphosphate kinase
VRIVDNTRYLNRELSWLDFGARLLDIAEDSHRPLLERVRFLAIFSEGLDEFFQVRIAGLKDQVEANIRGVSPDGMKPSEQLLAIREQLDGLLLRQEHIFLDQIVPSLAEAGIRLSDWESLDEDDKNYMVNVFNETIFPVLTPLAVDPGHPFPYISNLSLNLAVQIKDPSSGQTRFARVKVPPLLPRFVVMKDLERFVPLEQVIAAHLETLFSEMTILSTYSFRVTRNADLTLDEDEADDLLAAVEMELRRRRFGKAVRLELQIDTSKDVADFLTRELEVDAADVFYSKAPLDLGGLMSVYALDRPDLHMPTFKSVPVSALKANDSESPDIFKVLREKDILVHHPYESFTTSVQALIQQAAEDPNVLAIKQTLYRTSGDSPIVHALIKAAESGKQVAVLVELKARFDEQANIGWARALERAGVHVVYGLVGLKTHSKCVLIVRQEPDGIKRYCHIGTGNYNSKTARLYEDLGLLTSNEDIGNDLADLFNALTGYSRNSKYRKLVIAPDNLRSYIISEIEKQADLKSGGQIIIKVNGLTDTAIIDALYNAGNLGVDIRLLVRGVCSLRPGVKGLSENIRVKSIVGRFLEHSRIYRFGKPESGALYLIGSADLMERNLDRRVEALVRIEDPDLKLRLDEILDINLKDTANSWELDCDGEWNKVIGDDPFDSQATFIELAANRSKRTVVSQT